MCMHVSRSHRTLTYVNPRNLEPIWPQCSPSSTTHSVLTFPSPFYTMNLHVPCSYRTHVTHLHMISAPTSWTCCMPHAHKISCFEFQRPVREDPVSLVMNSNHSFVTKQQQLSSSPIYISCCNYFQSNIFTFHGYNPTLMAWVRWIE